MLWSNIIFFLWAFESWKQPRWCHWQVSAAMILSKFELIQSLTFYIYIFFSHSKYGSPSRKGIIQLFIWHWKILFLFHFNKNYSITSNTERSISSSQLFPLWFMIAPYCSATSNANVSAVEARIAPRRESCWNSTWWTLVEDDSIILDFQKRSQMHWLKLQIKTC